MRNPDFEGPAIEPMTYIVCNPVISLFIYKPGNTKMLS
uniref:Uncharacterized protein n=1 Tax=viral metagenome TaxID=1070528 RepID=A0A6C0AHI6_9ZZZZ